MTAADPTRILLAIDESPSSEAATQTLLTRFRPEHTEVRVIHAVEWLKDLPDSFRFGEGATYAGDIVARKDRSFQQAQQLVSGVADRLRAAGFAASTATPDADARHAIVSAALEWPADLIIMGSHGRRGFDRFVLGSVAESVVRHAPCSVQIVRTQTTAPSKPHLSGTIF